MEVREVLETLSGRTSTLEEQEAYARETELVRRDWLSGVGGRPYALVSREVAFARESDGAEGRTDLGSQISSGEDIPGLREVLRELLEREVNITKLDNMVLSMGGGVKREGNETEVTVFFERAVGWPEDWGGEWNPAEVRRCVTLTANHARWRDRRNRRLVALSVRADEIWADTAALDA